MDLISRRLPVLLATLALAFGAGAPVAAYGSGLPAGDLGGKAVVSESGTGGGQQGPAPGSTEQGGPADSVTEPGGGQQGPGGGSAEQGTGSTEQAGGQQDPAPGSTEQAGDGQQGSGSGEQGGSTEQAAGQQGSGSAEQAGDGQQNPGDGSGEQGSGSAEPVDGSEVSGPAVGQGALADGSPSGSGSPAPAEGQDPSGTGVAEDGDGALVEDEGGYRFVQSDGKVFTDGFKTVAGVTYYFGSEGYAVGGLATIGGKVYYFDEASFAQVFDMHAWGDGTYSYFSPEHGGAAAKRWWRIDGHRYYFDPDTRRTHEQSSGLDSIEGSYYKIVDGGWVFYGLYDWDEGTLSYFSPDHGGAAGKYRWAVDGKVYYFDASTRRSITGWFTWSDGKRSYFAPAYQGAAAKNRWAIDGKVYYFDPSSRKAVTGWFTWSDGKRSYFSPKHGGAAAQGWWTLSGKRYFFNRTTRKALTGRWKVSGKTYYFGSKGAMRTGWIEWNNGSGWSYFGDDGVMVVGVQIIDGVEYDFGTDGKVDHYLTDAQLRVIEACKTTPSPGGGLCAAWITYVFQNAGIGSWNGNADDMYFAYCKTSPSKIKPGMIIAVDSSPASAAGRIYGHVAIYIGNGKVMDNIGGSIRTVSLDEWVEYFSALSTPKCGWLGKVDLTK